MDTKRLALWFALIAPVVTSIVTGIMSHGVVYTSYATGYPIAHNYNGWVMGFLVLAVTYISVAPFLMVWSWAMQID